MNNLTLPLVNKQYSAQYTKDAAVIAKMLKQKYGATIALASSVVGVPADIIVGFMVIENDSGNPTAVSSAGAIGLMQLQPPTAYDVLRNQAKRGFEPQEISVINKYLPGFLAPGSSTVPDLNDTWKTKIKTALYNPEFNIWVGTLSIGQMLKLYDFDFSKLGNIVIRYNAGAGNYKKYIIDKNLSSADTTAIYNAIPFDETKNYILKFVGIGGTIEASIKSGINLSGSTASGGAGAASIAIDTIKSVLNI